MILRLFQILIIIISSGIFAQNKSPFNRHDISIDSSGDYSFIVSGHFYGDGTNKSHFPANTLLGNLDWINSSDASMLICLGDLFMDISNDIPSYKRSFFDKLQIPLFNAVGNHDLTANIYQENFGDTYYSFLVNNDVHIILDTEMDNGDIVGEQLELIKAARDQSRKGEIDNVFIYGHRTIWKDTYSEMEGLFMDNTQSISGSNFESDVFPLLQEIGTYSKVYCFAGSLGTAPASFFYHDDKENNLTIIATAIRALPRDAVLLIHIKDGEVEFEPHSLTGEELKDISEYNVDFWQTEVGAEPFNWKLVPYYFQVMLTHRFFWYGTTFAFMIILMMRLIKRRRRLS